MKYTIVNSFTNNKFKGNPAGVLLVKEFLDDKVMQDIAKQLNLVETVFVKRHNLNEYTMRYFTPQKELPVAGHPTIAALRVIHKEYSVPENSQLRIHTRDKILIGHIGKVESNGDTVYTLDMPDITHGCIVEDRSKIANVLGITEKDLLEEYPVKIVDAGLGHIIVPLKTRDGLFRVKRNIQALMDICQQYGAREVQAFTYDVLLEDNEVHTRNICPREGIEDPACGVGNSALLSYLWSVDTTRQEYSIEQGFINDFQSIIKGHIIDETRVRIGGHATIMAEGEIYL